MADNDFVERLRIRWETMGDMANDERAAAAAEIESLRHGQRELMAKVAALTTERDEARHGECVATATLQGVIEERTTLRAERDRKNLTIQALTEERDEVVRMANKLMNERDEARREVCSLQPFAHHNDGIAKDHAAYRGWDCFKEDTNG